jgi:AcrR family transcriptional regulator
MPVPKGATLDPARTRRQVLDAATWLFYARGIPSVGVNEIAAEAGVSKLSLYRHFASKDGLVEAVLSARSDRIAAWLRAAADDHAQDPAARVLAVFDALTEWYAGPEFRGCAILNAAVESRGTSPVPLVIARRHLDRHLALFTALAVDAGAPDPPALAAQLLLLMEGATAVAAVTRDAAPGRTARATAATLLRGLGGG